MVCGCESGVGETVWRAKARIYMYVKCRGNRYKENRNGKTIVKRTSVREHMKKVKKKNIKRGNKYEENKFLRTSTKKQVMKKNIKKREQV